MVCHSDAHESRDDTPYEHECREPLSGQRALQNDVGGDFEENVAGEVIVRVFKFASPEMWRSVVRPRRAGVADCQGTS